MFTTRENTHLAKAVARACKRGRPVLTTITVYGARVLVFPDGRLAVEEN